MIRNEISLRIKYFHKAKLDHFKSKYTNLGICSQYCLQKEYVIKSVSNLQQIKGEKYIMYCKNNNN